MSETITETVNNAKLFKKIVREYNASNGFNFVLPKDTDYGSRFAHPVHNDGVFKITSQMDDDNKKLYALNVKTGSTSFNVSDDVTYSQLQEVFKSEAFQYKLGAIKQLEELHSELGDAINSMRYTILDDAVTDMQREENYDLAVRGAKALYRNKIGE